VKTETSDVAAVRDNHIVPMARGEFGGAVSFLEVFR